jgi:uncharacterized repeat protein (TIGR03803 family)
MSSGRANARRHVLRNSNSRTIKLRQAVAATAYEIEYLERRVLLSATYVISTLTSFNGPNGSVPVGSLIADSNGNLYGTTNSGGAFWNGTVFEVASGSHTLTTLVSFNGTNGSNPGAGLIFDSAGNLYGITSAGGTNNDGTVFEVAAGTNALITLASFNGTNGNSPEASVIFDAAGNLYGTTSGGGANNDGTVFVVAAGTHTLTTLAAFNGTNGQYPHGSPIFDAAGNLYGTTLQGGANGGGTVFEVAATTHTLTTLVSFNGTNGNSPRAGLLFDAAGNLYGTTYGGGYYGDGTVFEVAASTHALTTLATFNGTNGSSPYAGLILDTSGNLYGTTTAGGSSSDGTAFEVAAATHTLTTLASFNGTNGGDLYSGLIFDSAGNLCGTNWQAPSHQHSPSLRSPRTSFRVPGSVRR